MPKDTIMLFELMLVLIESLAGKKANSKNSNLAPSQDPYRKRALRAKGKKKRGGQLGHEGSTIKAQLKADQTIIYPVGSCEVCHKDLSGEDIYTTKHQEIDVSFKLRVTEHIVEHAVCGCGHHQCDDLGQSAPVQYGAGLKATAVELNLIQCMSIARTAKFLRDKFDLTVSASSLVNFSKQAAQALLVWEEHAKDELLQSDKLHADETGMNVDGVNHWAHTVSNDKYTLIIPHQRRGAEAITDCALLTNYHGYLCHDFWTSYNALDVINLACHSHLRREFEKVAVDYKQSWAERLKNLLWKANEERLADEGGLAWKRIQYFERRYFELIEEGERLNPLNRKRKGKRGKVGQSYPRRLLKRLREKSSWVLLFMYDPTLPFTNNLVERDQRMLKVNLKIAGAYRTFEGLVNLCRIRSYIQSMQKQGVSPHQAMITLLQGT